MNKIIIVFRDPSRNGRSVEEIYHGLVKELSLTMNIGTYLYNDSRSVLYNCQSIKRLNPTLVHITSDVYFIANFLRNIKVIMTIHDIGRYKELNGIKKWLYQKLWLKWPILNSRVVIAVSEYTKLDVLNVIGSDYNRKIKVVYNPVPLIFSYTPRVFNVEKPVILAVGTGAHKNIETLFRSTVGLACKLVIVGKMNANLLEVAVASGAEWINYEVLSYPEIKDQYINCDLVYFVSLHEGFGMPVIEAQAIGRPVLISNRCSLPEVAGNGGYYIEDPMNISEVRHGIDQLINNESHRARCIEAGIENIKRFEFSRILEQYRVLYKQIAESK